MSQRIDLYGGAISCVIPKRFLDLSLIREVPDHQEVWNDPNRDDCLIFEIMNPTGLQDIVSSAHKHWEEINSLNQVSSQPIIISEILMSPSNLPNLYHDDQKTSKIAPESFLICSEIQASKDKEHVSNRVLMLMLLMPLHDQQSDILITLNSGLPSAPTSSLSIEQKLNEMETMKAMQLMKEIMQSFSIRDWRLFK